MLDKDREVLAFYNFPDEHRKPLRTTNVIESSFATVCHPPCAPTDVFPIRPRSP
jgi:transposase-like protein